MTRWGIKEEYFKERIGLPQTAVSPRSAVYVGRMNTQERAHRAFTCSCFFQHGIYLKSIETMRFFKKHIYLVWLTNSNLSTKS